MQKPKPPQKKLKESIIQKKIRLQYEADGWLVVKIIQTTKNGWPDLQLHKNNTTIFIETKATGKTASPLQRYRHKQLREKGFTVLTKDNYDQTR
jgi:hypothetical protein